MHRGDKRNGLVETTSPLKIDLVLLRVGLRFSVFAL
jgi:hypothetical protein